MCDEQLPSSIQNSLINGEVTINMVDVNDAQLFSLKRYQVEVTETTNYCKHLKNF